MPPANPASARNPSSATGFRLPDNQINLRAGRLAQHRSQPRPNPQAKAALRCELSEGRIRPSYIAANSPRRAARQASDSEGRIRPSYIAADSVGSQWR